MQNVKQFLIIHKITVILIAVLLVFGGLGYLGFQKISSQQVGTTTELDLAFDPEGPYALLFPRRDGNALVLNIKRTSSYDSISYDLAYTSIGDGEGSIDRGVSGTIDTKEKKGEYEQEILFGTCSKQVCKYDKGVENGTLTLHIRKGKQAFERSSTSYKMITQWHLQRPDLALGVLTSGDGHLNFQVDGDRQELSNIGFSIINDLTGVPKLPSGKIVTGKVYALNAPIAKELKTGQVSLELAENPGPGAKLYMFDRQWKELDTKIDGSKLSAKAGGAGIFAVLIPNK